MLPTRAFAAVLLPLLLLAVGAAGAREPEAVAGEGCSLRDTAAQRIACYSDLAVRHHDPTVCLSAESADERWPCIANYAVVAGDAGTCDLLPGPESESQTEGDLAQVSIDLCLTTLALVYRKPELCRSVVTPAMDDSCLAKLVSLGADPALCADIKSEELRAVCRPDPEAETER